MSNHAPENHAVRIVSRAPHIPPTCFVLRIKGTTQGTITDIDGNFNLANVPSSAKTLQISYIGMQTQEVAIKPNLKVVLRSDAQQIDEVVVTAMGIKRSEKALGYAATSVGGEKIAESRTSDVMSSLAGKIAGVQISSTSSDPGASNSVIIRGVSSLSGTNQPLYVVDGVGDIKELKYVKKFVVETADAEIAAAGSDLTYEVGTMIEIPRAALTADEIAKEADFFCFGTNDLTQMTYGFSRDDAGKFLDAYYDAKIFENDPFAKLDQVGVGKLMDMALKLGKPVNPSLHVGICGEHGGDPSSVEFCNKLGLDYVSCSPFRVPIARLAAAQAAINQK